MSLIKYLILFLMMTACTPSPESQQLPTEQKYSEDAALMINVCNKFAEEPDANKLHSAALAVQNTRVLACVDYNDECSIYGRFLALAIRVSEGGKISVADRTQMRTTVAELQTAVAEGKSKLHADWVKSTRK